MGKLQSQQLDFGSLSLPVLAEMANQAAESAERDLRSAVTHASTAGRALVAAKSKCSHGKWLPWLDSNWGHSQRLAHLYMELANSQRVANLESATSLREALRLISADKFDVDQEDESDDGDVDDVLDDSGDDDEDEGDDDDKSSPHVSRSSGNNEWYTPPTVISMARKAMGGIDLDPASCQVANEFVQAKKYFTAKDDGLSKDWSGRVWMNPPYAKGLVDAFTRKLTKHYQEEDITQAVVLVNNATDAAWFVQMAEVCAAICFTRGRIKFLNSDGQPENTPLQGQAVLYFGDRHGKFIESFQKLGICWRSP